MNKTNHELESKHKSSDTAQEVEKLELDLDRFLDGLKKFWWLCLILAVIGASVLYVRSSAAFTPRYSVSVTFTVQTQSIQTGSLGITSYSYSSNRATATLLSSAFPSIIKSNILQDVICNDLGLSYFPCSLSASVVPKTNMFTVTAIGTDAQLTYDVLQSVIRKYPEVAQYVIGNTVLDILTEPVFPTVPSNRFEYRTEIIKGALIGLAIGLAWVIVYSMMRNTVRSREDIRKKLNQNCIGILPNVTFKRYNREINRAIVLNNSLLGEDYLESFRALRNSLLASADDKRVIMVTSVAPGEGKTTVSVNLAMSLAMMNKKVILVDADVRNSNVAQTLGLPETDTNKNESKVCHITDYKIDEGVGMSVLQFNVEHYSIWKLFDIKRFQALFARLQHEYDYVIVDTSPVGLTSEPAIIAQVANLAVMVVKQDMVRTPRLLSALDTIMASNVKVAGCVLNGVSSTRSGYGYGYSHYGYGYGYYGYGYGYGYGKSRGKKRRSRKSAAKTEDAAEATVE